MNDLTTVQEAELHQLLLNLKAETEGLIQSSAASSQIVDLGQPIGRLSRMDALQQQAMAKANSNGLKKSLQLIESALQAFRQERYGDCRRCEEPIGYPRLKARPESPFCLECQTQMEGSR
jgi:RNA polymerase-binding transcription factor